MNESDGSTVLYEVEDGIATITMNRPEARNALSMALQRDLSAAFARADEDEEVRVVILTGAGPAFTAGVDLKEFGQTGGSTDEDRPDIWGAMDGCSKPIVGAVNGPAITGGFEVALACDVLIAGRSARFADTHGRVGVLPGAGLSQRLPRAIGIYRAKYLSLTGNFLDGQTAFDWGLASHLVDDEELMDTARQVARDMLGLQPHMLPAMKQVIDDGFAMTFGDAMPMESKRSHEQVHQANAWRGAGAAFADVRDRGREQK